MSPRAPHWYDFSKVDEVPNDWSFEALEWNDDPDAYGVVNRGEAEVVRDGHRFVIETWLQPRERTHDRYWSIAYETVNQNDEPEPLSFHIGRDSAIARNNLGHARDILDSDDRHTAVLVRHHERGEGERETFEFPSEYLAEKAADLQLTLKVKQDDRDYLVDVCREGEQ